MLWRLTAQHPNTGRQVHDLAQPSRHTCGRGVGRCEPGQWLQPGGAHGPCSMTPPCPGVLGSSSGPSWAGAQADAMCPGSSLPSKLLGTWVMGTPVGGARKSLKLPVSDSHGRQKEPAGAGCSYGPREAQCPGTSSVLRDLGILHGVERRGQTRACPLSLPAPLSG